MDFMQIDGPTEEQLAEMKAAQDMARKKVMSELESKLDGWITATKPLHDRWIQDLRQYDGKPRGASVTKIEHNGSESVGPPMLQATRYKTDLIEARQADMLFPATLAQWRLEPEPEQDPEIIQGIVASLPPTEDEAAQTAAIEAEIKRRVQALEKKVADCLSESDFAKIGRNVIRDACRIGPGLFVGPVNRVKRKERYRQSVSEANETIIAIEVEETTYPAIEIGDPFRFIPEPVTDLSKATGAFYLELMTEQKIKELGMLSYADPDGITETLKTPPVQGRIAAMIKERHQHLGFEESLDGRYFVWRYTGQMTRKEWNCLCPNNMTDLEEMPLVDMYFCQGNVLAAKFYALPKCWRIPYWVYTPAPDLEGWAGLSVAYQCRDSMRSAQAAWEMALRNGSVSSGPLIFHRGKLIPNDTKMEVRGPKFFLVPDSEQSLQDQVHVEVIPNNMPENLSLVDRCLAQMDEDLNLPQYTNPEVNKPTQTASGMAMWMNAQTVVQRRAAASFDDCVKGIVEAIVKWIKTYDGDNPDYQVDVRAIPLGQSELLVKDVQIQNLMTVMSMAQGPLAEQIDQEELGRIIAQKFELPASALMTPEKRKARQENQQPDPAVAELELKKAKLDAEIADKQRGDDFRAQDRLLDNQERMAEIELKREALIVQQQMKLADLQLAAQKLASDERISIAQAQAKLGIAEMQQATNEMIAGMNARMKAEQIARDNREMAVKLSPINPTNTGI